MMNTIKENLRTRYGWIICITSALLLFCTGGLTSTGFSAYQPYLISISGLSNTQSSTLILIRIFFTLVGMMITGRLINLLEVRRLVSISMLICSTAFLIYGLSNSFVLYSIAAVFAGISMGAGGMIPVSILITRWFNEHRGLALGICMASTGVSAMVSSPFITYMVEHFSLKTSFFTESAFIFAAAFAVYFILRSNPSCLHTEPIGADHVDTSKTYAKKEAAKGLYLCMMLGVFLFGIPANIITAHISVLYRTSGFNSSQVALLLSVFGICLAIGKCSYGMIADAIGTYWSSWILYGLVFFGSILSCMAGNHNFIMGAIAVISMGLGFAVTTVSISMYASKISTQKSYSSTVTRFQILSTLGSLVFGSVPGIMADKTGSYVPAFVIMTMIAVVSAAILQISYYTIRHNQ